MKYSLSILIGCLFFNNLIAQSSPRLSEKEVRGTKRFQFENKSNRRASDETRAQHDAIGKKLSQKIQNQPEKVHTVEGVSILRIDTESDRLGADVISVGTSTKFGHVNSLLRIITSYLESTFEYSEDDAEILAKYILYYNAINRGNVEYITSKYNTLIEDKIKEDRLGISNNYREWPGRTQIIVPIERNVLKKFDKDITLEELGNTVNEKIDENSPKEDEKKRFEELVENKKKEEKKLIAEKNKELEKTEKSLEEKKKDLDVKLGELGNDSDDKKEAIIEEKEKIEEKISEIEETKTALKEREDKIEGNETPEEKNEETPPESSERKAEESPEEEKKTETVATADPALIQKELEKVKDELNAKLEAEKKKAEFSDNVVDGKIPFIKMDINMEGQCSNEIHLLDPTKDDLVFKGEYNQICGRVFKEFGGNLLVIGLKDSKDQVRLILLSKKNLKPSGNSEVNVYTKSFLEINENFLYAIENDNGKYYLSRFDKNLKRILRTDQDVQANSVITIYGNKIYTNGTNEAGKVEIKVFNKEDLKFLKKTSA
ncbi:MAG: hypothetical protein KDK54_06975 [Leptospiraceae bacterium]|nr:hypothetical protein [Leptospiraceae bacterium]